MTRTHCVGCGWCCLTDQCRDSHIRYGYLERCPDIYWDEAQGLYRCRLAHDPETRRNQAMGKGCCAPLNSWRKDVRNRDGG